MSPAASARHFVSALRTIRFATLCGCATFLISGAHPLRAVEPDAMAILKESEKAIAAAGTLRVTAKHKVSGEFELGAALERGPITLTVKRPNKVHALQRGKDEVREIAFDGRNLVMIFGKLNHHAIESVRAASLSDFAEFTSKNFGFRPPLLELVAADFTKQILSNGATATLKGRGLAGLTNCDHVQITQEGLTGDLWIGVKDRLPRRLLLTFTSLPENPTWDIRIQKWELGIPVDEAIFGPKPPKDSYRVRLLKADF